MLPSPAGKETRIEIAPFDAPAAQLVTARTYLLDRFVPECEVIALPPKTVAGGTLAFGPGPLPPVAVSKSLRHILRKTGTRAAPGGVVFDLRLKSPENWAHFLNNHLAIVFRICASLDLPLAEVTLILPAGTPNYIKAAADLFGLRHLETADTVEGQGLLFTATPWTGIRPARADWIRASPASRLLKQAGLPQMGSKRVFLARRNTRTLINETEVTDWFVARGFDIFYPEDLSVAEQFALFHHAEVVAGIHGAGFAPLLYAPKEGPLRQCVEILPCGHMTDVYRVMCAQLGIHWVGVRGRIKPEYVTPAYRLGAGFEAFSLDAFEVDIASLERAFEIAQIL